jgi:hypothetical protein
MAQQGKYGNPKAINPSQSSNKSVPSQPRPDNFESAASGMKGKHPNSVVEDRYGSGK